MKRIPFEYAVLLVSVGVFRCGHACVRKLPRSGFDIEDSLRRAASIW